MIEAMKQALEALERTGNIAGFRHEREKEAITSLRQAIEQAEKREPVAYVTDLEFDSETELIPSRRKGQLGTDGMDIPLYAQPQREWVGLTDEEVKDIVWNLPYEPSQEHIRAIEAKLKEKNT